MRRPKNIYGFIKGMQRARARLGGDHLLFYLRTRRRNIYPAALTKISTCLCDARARAR